MEPGVRIPLVLNLPICLSWNDCLFGITGKYPKHKCLSKTMRGYSGKWLRLWGNWHALDCESSKCPANSPNIKPIQAIVLMNGAKYKEWD